MKTKGLEEFECRMPEMYNEKIEDFKYVEVKIQIYTKRLDKKQLDPAPICSSSLWRQMVEGNHSFQC